MKRIALTGWVFVGVGGASTGTAQPAGQGGPTPRDLGAVVATSAETFSPASYVVPLGERVLVHDPTARMVKLLDGSLRTVSVVFDSAAGSLNNSGGPSGFLMSFRGDSAVYFATLPTTMIVVGPDGRPGRAITPPAFASGPLTEWVRRPSVVTPMQWSSVHGFLYHALKPRSDMGTGRRGTGTFVAAVRPPGQYPREDSSFLVRMNLETRAIDTFTHVSRGSWSVIRVPIPAGLATANPSPAPPFPFYDAVVATRDGAIAVFRAREYRVEWWLPDGTRLPGARLSYPWRPITDAERARFIDSANAARKYSFDSTLAQRAADSVRTGRGPTRTVNFTAAGVRGTREQALEPPWPPLILTDVEVPSFHPPTGPDAMLADADGNVWLRPAAYREPGAIVWEIVDRTRGVIDRVRIPEGRRIAGFAPGHVFVLTRPDAGASRIQKVRVR